MTYRFLPVVRRGLAGHITDPDPMTPTLAARARFPVRVRVSTGDTADVALRLFGPGDIIGVDPRAIVRTDPVRFARNVEPDEFASIEFDPPDFPWMFSPAAPNADVRLRPWVVLVVVRRQDGVSIQVPAGRPLPQLVIEQPAVPADELPDLTESWAWAHAHVVEAAPPASVAGNLRDNPDLNVSRLLCPRRLEPDHDYLACLVPAFEVGRLAGLGQQGADAATTAPAWTGGVGATITLPTYFHWEFRTGPAGDFESLARRLTPRPVPDTVGHRRMFIGAAHAALPPLPPDAGGIVELEGALRAPDAGTGTALGPQQQPWVEALVELLDTPAKHVVEGASPDAEAVAPPIYGGWPVQVTQLGGPEPVPVWLRELNSDPRHRAAAGLGAEVVRINQERFMQAAWVQVGDVLAANALLDRARFVQELADRVHRRYIAPLGQQALLALTAPVHERVQIAGGALDRALDRSTLPTGVLDASFRRVASPRSTTLTRATRVLTGGAAEVASVSVVNELAAGQRTLDVLAHPPDGLVASRLLDRIAAQPGGPVGAELGMVATVAPETVTAIRGSIAQLVVAPPPATVALRPDLAISGVVLPTHFAEIRAATGGGLVTPTIGTVLTGSLHTPDAVGFAVVPSDDGGVDVDVIARDERGVVAGRVRPGVDPVEPLHPIGSVFTTGAATHATLTTGAITGAVIAQPGGGGLGPIGPGEVVISGPGSIILAPVKEHAVVTLFANAFAAHQQALTISATSIVPAPTPVDMVSTRQVLVAALDPHAVVERRALLAVRVEGRALVEGLPGAHVRQRAPLDPVMIGPLLPEPLYQGLASADPDRFLPGIGDIPDDTVTMVETNPRFVEAFLVGANHEMNRELLWRRYPTDRRGTPFHRFWDRAGGAEDIGAIDQFDPSLALGVNSGADLRGSLVLLVRGQLLRRYPNATVYAVPARADGSMDPDPAHIADAAFGGRIDPDVTFVGFDLTREDVEVAPGWYFVIAEQPVEPRFGFDVPPAAGGGNAPSSWSDVHWGHLGAAPGQYLRLAGNPFDGRELPIIAGKPATARFGGTSADLAAISFQRPFRAAIHSSKIIAGASPATGPVGRPFLTHAVLLGPQLLRGDG